MHRSSFVLALSTVCAALSGACADTGDAPAGNGTASPSYGYDAGPGGYDAARPSVPSSPSAPSSPSTPASPSGGGGTAKAPLEGLDLGGLLGDGGLFAPSDGGGGGSSQKGELDPNGAVNPQLPPKKDNPPECPSLAPPNPVGSCLGLPIYLFCGYGSEGGPQYTCTCDWYHWLCA